VLLFSSLAGLSTRNLPTSESASKTIVLNVGINICTKLWWCIFRIEKVVNVYLLYSTEVHEKKILKSNGFGYFHISNQKREVYNFLCSVDRSSLYNLVNETNLSHTFILSVFCQFYL